MVLLQKFITIHGHLNVNTTNSMQQSPSREANMSPATQEIPRVSRNPKVHYRIHNNPTPVPTLSHTKTVHAPYATS